MPNPDSTGPSKLDYTYAAFISYSHRADAGLSRSLQSALGRFARPWYRRRALRLFRDDTDLSVSPGLWPSIEQGLAASAHFILLASPAAAASRWVGQELAYWLTHRSARTLLIVLTEGDIVWDDAAGDFDWGKTTALPRSLSKAFSEQPLFLDLRWTRAVSDLGLKNAAFRDATAGISAVLHGRSKDSMIGEDLREHRRTMRIAASVVIGLAALVGLAVFQRGSIQREEKIALARKLATQAQLVRDQRPTLLPISLLLALESMRIAPSPEAEQLARQNLNLMPRPIYHVGSGTSVNTVAFSLDGKYLATAGNGNTARIWDASTGREVQAFRHSEAVSSVAFTPDATSLVVLTLGGIGVWDIASGRQVRKPLGIVRVDAMHSGYTDPAKSLAISPDGRRLATAHFDGRVRLQDIDGEHEIVVGTHDVVAHAVAFSPDNAFLVTGSGDNTARVWSLANGAEVMRLPHTSCVLSVAFDAHGGRIATGGCEGVARVWDRNSGRELTRFDLRTMVQSVAFSPDGSRLATAGDDNLARLWDLTSGVETARMVHDDPVQSVAFSPDGRRLATGTKEGTVTAWETGGGPERAVLPHPDWIVTSIAYSPEGGHVATATDRLVRVWDVASAREVQRMEHDSRVSTVAYGPDGSRIATATDGFRAGSGSSPPTITNPGVHLWDVTTGNENPADGSRRQSGGLQPRRHTLRRGGEGNPPHRRCRHRQRDRAHPHRER